ncbi:MAG TPA: ABC transporter ATP-binding protein [bacterium]|jgi:multiple sugar transport system ATP-binding protein|nr:ABC transporter ATP-binding protein [bacterium]
MSEIVLREVLKRYGTVQAVRGLSFEVDAGELFCLLGPPGMGKTTVLRLIAGLERPDAGEILVDGQPVQEARPGQRDVAMVFDDIALYPHMHGFDNIAHPLRRRRLRDAEVRRRVDDVAALLGISHLLGRLPHTFSGGEQQRVAVARAIVREPKILLLDQPLSNLDAKVREVMIGELRHLQQRIRQTAIYATHDYEEAMALGDRILILHDGQADQIGTPDEVYSRPTTTLAATVTGSPPMNLISCRVHNGQAVVDGWTVPVDGAPEEIILGIRPEHVRLGEGVPGVIDLVQPLGRRKIVEVLFSEVRLKAVAPPDFQGARGMPVRVTLNPQDVRVYTRAGRLTPAQVTAPPAPLEGADSNP